MEILEPILESLNRLKIEEAEKQAKGESPQKFNNQFQYKVKDTCYESFSKVKSI